LERSNANRDCFLVSEKRGATMLVEDRFGCQQTGNKIELSGVICFSVNRVDLRVALHY